MIVVLQDNNLFTWVCPKTAKLRKIATGALPGTTEVDNKTRQAVIDMLTREYPGHLITFDKKV